jgi:hypothetical protein
MTTKEDYIIEVESKLKEDLICGGNLTVNGDFMIDGSLEVDGDVTIIGNFTNKGNITIKGNLEVDGYHKNIIKLSSKEDNKISILGDVTINGFQELSMPFENKGSLEVTKGLYSTSTVIIKGTYKTNKTNCSQLYTNKVTLENVIIKNKNYRKYYGYNFSKHNICFLDTFISIEHNIFKKEQWLEMSSSEIEKLPNLTNNWYKKNIKKILEKQETFINTYKQGN